MTCSSEMSLDTCSSLITSQFGIAGTMLTLPRCVRGPQPGQIASQVGSVRRVLFDLNYTVVEQLEALDDELFILCAAPLQPRVVCVCSQSVTDKQKFEHRCALKNASTIHVLQQLTARQ